MRDPRVIFRVHAIEKMYERFISEAEVREVLDSGETVEEYPDDLPEPSRLLLGWVDRRPLHVVASYVPDGAMIIVVTAYEPTLAKWEPGFRRRRDT